MAKAFTLKDIKSYQFDAPNEGQNGYSIESVENFREKVKKRYQEIAKETNDYYQRYNAMKDKYDNATGQIAESEQLKNENAQLKKELKKYQQGEKHVSESLIEVSRLKQKYADENEAERKRIEDEANEKATNIVKIAEEHAAHVISEAHEKIKKDEDQSRAYINDINQQASERLGLVTENNKAVSKKMLGQVTEKSKNILGELYEDSKDLQQQTEDSLDHALNLHKMLSNVTHELNQFINRPALTELAERVQGRDSEQTALKQENDEESKEIEATLSEQSSDSDSEMDKIHEESVSKLPEPREIEDESNLEAGTDDETDTEESQDDDSDITDEWKREKADSDKHVNDLTKTLNIETDDGEKHHFDTVDKDDSDVDVEDDNAPLDEDSDEISDTEDDAESVNEDEDSDGISDTEDDTESVDEDTDDTPRYHEVTRDDEK